MVLFLLLAGTLAAFAGIVTDLRERGVVSDALSGTGVGDAAFRAAENSRVFMTQLQFVLLLFTAIAFITWLARVDWNVRAWGATDLPFARWWAVGGWFVPLANLVVPGRLAQVVWAGSDPSLPSPIDDRWKHSPTSPLIMAWWLAFVAAVITSRVGASAISGAADFEELRSALLITAFSDVLFVAAGIGAFMLVREVTLRQRMRAGIILDRPPSALLTAAGG